LINRINAKLDDGPLAGVYLSVEIGLERGEFTAFVYISNDIPDEGEDTVVDRVLKRGAWRFYDLTETHLDCLRFKLREDDVEGATSDPAIERDLRSG
jgi:hypothetical protein